MACCRGSALSRLLELEGYGPAAAVIAELTSGSEEPPEVQELRADLQQMVEPYVGSDAEVVAGMLLDLLDTRGPVEFREIAAELRVNLRHAGITDGLSGIATLQEIWPSIKERAFRQ